jgi:hypothetical protein
MSKHWAWGRAIERGAARVGSARPHPRPARADRLRGGRQGWTAAPAPPARGVRWNPNLMLLYAERPAHMPLDRSEQHAMIQLAAQREHESVR